MHPFTRCIRIDYSGAETAGSNCKGIRVFMAGGASEPAQHTTASEPRAFYAAQANLPSHEPTESICLSQCRGRSVRRSPRKPVPVPE